MSFERARDHLLRSLRLLAQPAPTQMSHLRRQVGDADCGDELRHAFESAMQGARAFIGRGIEPSQAEPLQALTVHFRTMAAHDRSHQLWTDRALRNSADWARIRELAAQALIAFDAWPRRWGKGRRRAIRASAEAAKRNDA